jgi:hypothetical protein
MRMMIDKSAPVIASGSIKIVSDLETVWKVMAEIDRWPDWNPDVKWAALEGMLAEGSKFRWKAGRGTIRSTIRQAESLRTLALDRQHHGNRGGSCVACGGEQRKNRGPD